MPINAMQTRIIKTMDVTSMPGLKVIFSKPTSGFAEDQAKAERYLKPESVYTIDQVFSNGFYEMISLKEVAGRKFNPVQFENYADYIKARRNPEARLSQIELKYA